MDIRGKPSNLNRPAALPSQLRRADWSCELRLESVFGWSRETRRPHVRFPGLAPPVGALNRGPTPDILFGQGAREANQSLPRPSEKSVIRRTETCRRGI